MAEDSEQNKSQEATPYKLTRAREKGQVARGMDLGYLGGLAALAGFLIVAGEGLANSLSLLMRRALGAGIAGAGDPQGAAAMVGALYWPALQPVLLFAGTAVGIVLFLEIVQLRGISFSSHPLKPDFSRINPGKGLKRLFSMRMLKEAFKNVFKFAVYAAMTYFVVRGALAAPGRAGTDAAGLAGALQSSGMRLLLLFILTALFFAAIDQVMVRREFAKQMRMSRSEVTREHKEREGEPRLKQKRKQIHAEFAKQAKAMNNLPGSDLLIVNPEHFAVALAYRPGDMAAPTVTAKARNNFALAMKREAFRLGIPIFELKPLARALYAECEAGREIPGDHFRAVADLYLKLQAARSTPQPKNRHGQ
ncbi:MAG TPA: EscU/YscU/HrcU family type III secretion system export apparatus switch protein [Allosphingosinicella sp.]|jgi:flagellar biosynthetic protein FlhB